MEEVQAPVQPAARAEVASHASSLRVAVATRDGQRVDLHFGAAESFRVFDVDADGPRLVEDRQIAQHALSEEEDKRETIYRMISDCSALLVAKIGATPQEALAKIGIESTNLHAGKNVVDALSEFYAAKFDAWRDAPIDATDFRLLHAMLRVADLDRSIEFYTQRLGMRVLERREHKKNMFSQAYLGYGADGDGMTIELVANWLRDESYVPGDAFGHIAIGVDNITRLCDRLAAAGVPMPRPPRSQRHGENIVAFIEDPDGYRIELIQAPSPEAAATLEGAPLAQS
ncbi:lactoylglutathione lyase [Methylocystis bryophila]|uniref:Aldoketomutase n=2 Tax=Methylocystis bryophila TaxID=655015 RepID=A0A1W6MT85_9HYPH|nr:lactoylglutathione lyase [Methylocystis bryophila]